MKSLDQYAAKPVLVLSGSLLVLSVALNNIGLGDIVDAYAKSIVINLENSKKCDIDQSIINKIDINSELIKGLTLDNEILKEYSHKPKG